MYFVLIFFANECLEDRIWPEVTRSRLRVHVVHSVRGRKNASLGRGRSNTGARYFSIGKSKTFTVCRTRTDLTINWPELTRSVRFRTGDVFVDYTCAVLSAYVSHVIAHNRIAITRFCPKTSDVNNENKTITKNLIRRTVHRSNRWPRERVRDRSPKTDGVRR